MFVNARLLDRPTTGIQRYADEIISRLPKQLVHISPRTNLSGWRAMVWEQTRLLQESRTGFLWSPANTGPVAHKRHVVTMHDCIPLYSNSGTGVITRQLLLVLYRKAAQNARAIITPSEYSKIELARLLGVSFEKIVVIPNGANMLTHDAKLELRPGNGLSSHRWPSRKKIILAVGGSNPRKNNARLVRAWSKMQADFPDCHLVIVGSKSPSLGPGNELRSAPGITITNHVSDQELVALYRQATVFACMSLMEGFGLPALEAMASGTPVLASNTTAVPEVVGDAGILVDPLDTQAIADGLELLLTDEALRKELSRKGLERAKQFSWEEAARRTWEVLEGESQK